MTRYVTIEGKKVEVSCEVTRNRYGFNHIVSMYTPYGRVTNKVHYINRTWEAHPFDSAIRGLCDKYSMLRWRIKSSRSFYTAKKNEFARQFAREMADTAI